MKTVSPCFAVSGFMLVTVILGVGESMTGLSFLQESMNIMNAMEKNTEIMVWVVNRLFMAQMLAAYHIKIT